MSTSDHPARTGKTASAPGQASQAAEPRKGLARIYVRDLKRGRPPLPIPNAPLSIYRASKAVDSVTGAPDLDGLQHLYNLTTDRDGYVLVEEDLGSYVAFVNLYPGRAKGFTLTEDCDARVEVDLGLQYTLGTEIVGDDCKPITDCAFATVGNLVQFTADVDTAWSDPDLGSLELVPPPGGWRASSDPQVLYARITHPRQAFRVGLAIPPVASAGNPDAAGTMIDSEITTDAVEASPREPQGPMGVALSRGATSPTPDIAFWQALLDSTDSLSFDTYLRFMQHIFCGDADVRGEFSARKAGALDRQGLRMLPFTDTDAYRLIKVATEAFVTVNCGVLSGDPRDPGRLRRRDLPSAGSISQYLVSIPGPGQQSINVLPYLALIRSKLPEAGIKLNTFRIAAAEFEDCHGILREKLEHPCMLELIWSYWQEEGMLVQTLNAITRRFQNMRSPGERDALANLDIDPLRPLSNLLWGYTQDEQHRLSLMRRNYEYDHHYGLRLEGKAVPPMRPADSRSRFLEAFHNLLRLCLTFYKQDDDTTVKADAFPVLNALKEVHLILSQGAHNQFGDLPSTARIEMLMQQWLLARPEFREFLPTRVMVAYPEPWMDRVDAMKKMQGWSDTSVLHFRNLAIFGEQLLLSIRWGHWSDEYEPLSAFNWARFFRPQVQGYVHAYRAATGVDMAADKPDVQVEATLPSVLMQRRLAGQQRATARTP